MFKIVGKRLGRSQHFKLLRTLIHQIPDLPFRPFGVRYNPVKLVLLVPRLIQPFRGVLEDAAFRGFLSALRRVSPVSLCLCGSEERNK